MEKETLNFVINHERYDFMLLETNSEKVVLKKDLTEGTILLELNSPIMTSSFQVIERKGWGHPDKLADDLGEKLSAEYAKYTLEKCGGILHHNFDKLCLLGGSSKVSFGKGEMTKPIRVLVNGRASLIFNDQELNIPSLLRKVCVDFFRERLPLLDPEKDLSIELNISTASSPGRVFAANNVDNDRNRWFQPKSLADLPEKRKLHANDTSIGTGYAPLSTTEQLVLKLVDLLSDHRRKDFPQWMGTDVKVMAFSTPENIDITACVPQIAKYVKSPEEYVKNMQTIKRMCQEFVKIFCPQIPVSFTFNARDKLESNELYLTATGSSIESGDEGVVGRGNRVNGLITPMRPMNVEGANGKNPVYHVGKLYNVLANRLAQRLHEELGGGVVVNLISRTGGNLLEPWKIIVQMEKGDVSSESIFQIVENILPTIPGITKDIINGAVTLS